MSFLTRAGPVSLRHTGVRHPPFCPEMNCLSSAFWKNVVYFCSSCVESIVTLHQQKERHSGNSYTPGPVCQPWRTLAVRLELHVAAGIDGSRAAHLLGGRIATCVSCFSCFFVAIMLLFFSFFPMLIRSIKSLYRKLQISKCQMSLSYFFLSQQL